jgi:hypothetical protein
MEKLMYEYKNLDDDDALKKKILNDLESCTNLSSYLSIRAAINRYYTSITFAASQDSDNYVINFTKTRETSNSTFYCMNFEGNFYEFFIQDHFDREIIFEKDLEASLESLLRQEAIKALLLMGPYSENSTIEDPYYY